MQIWERGLNALVVLILCGVLLSAYFVQFFWHEEPCPLCLLQRLGMISVAAGLLLNLFFGVRMSHYALSLLSCLFGGFVALRQISLHVCPGFSTFGLPVLGLSLYTWSFIVFACAVCAISLILFLYRPDKSEQVPLNQEWFSKFALGLTLAISLANILTTYLQCGWGVCE
ncbi:disulfide bond formation protein B [Parachlamydia acanthamoebae]|uniref:disulfide bond formation protein B n=1 Tax=Parachlamydia acanthamoebae TaxID=83552 RepID=UPI0007519C8B|nr:disulfide bond formation protein B [Parachlamydia acanthamoebae]